MIEIFDVKDIMESKVDTNEICLVCNKTISGGRNGSFRVVIDDLWVYHLKCHLLRFPKKWKSLEVVIKEAICSECDRPEWSE